MQACLLDRGPTDISTETGHTEQDRPKASDGSKAAQVAVTCCHSLQSTTYNESWPAEMP